MAVHAYAWHDQLHAAVTRADYRVPCCERSLPGLHARRLLGRYLLASLLGAWRLQHQTTLTAHVGLSLRMLATCQGLRTAGHAADVALTVGSRRCLACSWLLVEQSGPGEHCKLADWQPRQSCQSCVWLLTLLLGKAGLPSAPVAGLATLLGLLPWSCCWLPGSFSSLLCSLHCVNKLRKKGQRYASQVTAGQQWPPRA